MIGTYKSYTLGFVLCLLLTLAAYLSVISLTYPIPIVIGCGLLQIITQLLLFIHLNKENKPRWNLVVFLFMVLVTVIIVAGSIWIMANLNYRMMPQM